MKVARHLLPAILPLAFLALTACSQLEKPPKAIRHYMLEYTPPHIAFGQRLPVSLKVTPFQSVSVLSSRQIIYRQADFRRETYIYHQWRIPPADMITDLFVRDRRRNNLFMAIAAPGQHFPVTHVLSGTLDQFMEVDHKKHSDAVLSVTLTLTSNDPGAGIGGILLQRNYTYRRAISEPPPLGLTRAMSLAMADFSAAAIHDIHAALVRGTAPIR